MEILCSVKTQVLLLKRALIFNKPSKRTAVDLAHRVYGAGRYPDSPHIIILHGLLGSKQNWHSMSKRLSPATKRIVVAVDLRNHGESPHQSPHTYPELAADVKQLLDKLSIKAATVIGHSMGGRTAMVLALTEPSRVEKLVVVDVSPISTPGVLNDFFPRLLDVLKSVKFDPKDDAAQARQAAKYALQSSKITDDINSLGFVLMNVGKRYDGKIGWMCNTEVLKSEFATIASFPTEMAGKTYDGPTLFVAGELSNYVPLSDLKGLQGYFPRVQLQYIPNVGHNVHAEDPDAFFNLVTTFMANT